jgi:Gram-negative bacterial TonB protein C-terminal
MTVGLGISAIQWPEKPPRAGLRAPFTERGALRLFVRSDSFLANFRESLQALASPNAQKSRFPSNHFLRGTNVANMRIAGRPLGASFLLHCSLLGLLIYLPHAIPTQALSLSSTRLHMEKIYYRIPTRNSVMMPRVAPAGLGGRPGSGSLANQHPALGSTARHPSLTIVSKPAHPDNLRQTIYQPASPPDLRITTEQKLPNIMLGLPSETPKAPLTPINSKPKQVIHETIVIDAPSVAVGTRPAVPITTLLSPSDTPPKLAIPLSSGGAPIQRSRTGSESASGGNSSDVAGLVILGVDPAGPTDQFSLPGGNRWGEFTIAPPTMSPGSPGGDPSGAVGGGTGGAGSGGDGSTGVGSGGVGGGGGRGGNPGPISIEGRGASGEGTLNGAYVASMVFPIEAPALTFRKNALVVSAGPIGGGGTNVYGALNCGKIYSIFLPMPGKNWSLQYCARSARPQQMPSEARSSVVHLDKPLLPPDVDLKHRFDFKRIPVAVEKSHRAIVLKGVIGVDGSVRQLVVYQGVVPEMDEAARLAFSQWQFRPAMEDGKPVEVEILVAIPPPTGEDHVSR